jgi:hypothetical protein
MSEDPLENFPYLIYDWWIFHSPASAGVLEMGE